MYTAHLIVEDVILKKNGGLPLNIFWSLVILSDRTHALNVKVEGAPKLLPIET